MQTIKEGQLVRLVRIVGWPSDYEQSSSLELTEVLRSRLTDLGLSVGAMGVVQRVYYRYCTVLFENAGEPITLPGECLTVVDDTVRGESDSELSG